jgi:polygalacturonase
MPLMKYNSMKVKFLLIIIVLTYAFASSVSAAKGYLGLTDSVPRKEQVGASRLPSIITPVKAPFAMAQFKKPVFPKLTINITAKGAKEGTKITSVVQAAINQVSQRGGGTVIVPKGKWFSGRIVLRSNVNLHFEDGAELTFSGELEDYQPAVFTRNEGIELMSLGACIYANGQENIAVTGKGRLIGPAKGSPVRERVMDTVVIESFVSYKAPVAKRVYDGSKGGYVFPVMFISPINCKKVYIEGVYLENTAFWNIVPVYCDNVIIRGITVNSVGIQRGDGIDIESSRNVLIEYNTLSCGDDCFTIKAGRNEDGLRVNKPSENIVVRYCLALEGHGGITCGSETAGMIRNLYVHDCVFQNSGTGIRFKTRRPRAGGGKNLYYERIRMNISGPAFEWDMLGSATHMGKLASRYPPLPVTSLTPSFSNIKATNILVEKASRFVKANGIPEQPLKDVLIDHSKFSVDKLWQATDVDGFEVRNTFVRANDPNMNFLDTRNIKFDKVTFEVPGGQLIKNIAGKKSGNISFEGSKTVGLKTDGAVR